MMAPVKDLAVCFIIRLQPESLARVPEELIYHIIQYLDPHELLDLQAVSKQFQAIVNDVMVWRSMYRNARLPRPPGPFPWQSVWFLRCTLVRSARLAQRWISQSMKVRASSRRRILSGLDSIDDYKWVSQRWLIGGGDIVSYDIDTGSQQTLWNNRDGRVSCCQACSSISAQGHLIYVALRTGRGERHDAANLLEFRVDDDTGKLSGPILFDIPARHLEEKPHICARSANAPWVYVSMDSRERLENALIFNIRSRNFYRFPPFKSQLTETHSSSPFHLRFDRSIGFLFTTTHIFAVFHFHPDNLKTTTARLVQAFVVPEFPSPGGDEIPELHLSHETIHRGLPLSLTLIRNSIVNTVDGSTTVRFMHTESSSRLTFSCTEFSLPRSRTDAILPISITTHEILSVDGWNGGEYIQASDDGFVRGFCMDTSVSGDSDHYSLCRFTIDASGERCVALVGDRSSPESGVEFAHSEALINWFDGGRVCYYVKECGDTEDDQAALVSYVVDLV